MQIKMKHENSENLFVIDNDYSQHVQTNDFNIQDKVIMTMALKPTAATKSGMK